MVAAHRGDASLIAMLLSAKADVNLKNKVSVSLGFCMCSTVDVTYEMSFTNDA